MLSKDIETVLNSDEATYSIAKRTGVQATPITSLRNGTKTVNKLRLATAEKLADDADQVTRQKVTALLATDLTSYAISKATGVKDTTVLYLRNGKKQLDNLQLDSVEKLASYQDHLQAN